MSQFSNSVEGWLYLENEAESKYWELFVEEFYFNPDWDISITHAPGNIHFNVPIEKVFLTFYAINIHITDNTDFESFMAQLYNMQEDTYFTLAFYKNTSKDKLKMDGTNTEYQVKIPKGGFKRAEKVGKGNTQHYKIGMIKFEEAN